MPKAKTPKLSPIVGKIVDLLTPLSPEDRGKAISAARTLLGEAGSIKESPAKGGGEETDGEVDTFATSGKAKTWQKQNGIAGAELAQVFHSDDGKTEVIAATMPGANSRQQTLNGYVLTGIATSGQRRAKVHRRRGPSTVYYRRLLRLNQSREGSEEQRQLVHWK